MEVEDQITFTISTGHELYLQPRPLKKKDLMKELIRRSFLSRTSSPPEGKDLRLVF